MSTSDLLGNSPLDVAIIGAGLSGLACAARLRQLGVERFKVFEQGDGVADFWRGHYDRLSLHSPFHDLPDDGGLRDQWGMFLARDEVVDYLAAYADHHRLEPYLQFGTRVATVRRSNDFWELEVPGGVARARCVVMATAVNRKPRMPELAGEKAFTGRRLHSRGYRNAEPFVGDRVLVIGSGNSAAEIALDLSEGGAAAVALWVRAPRHVLSLARYASSARISRRLGLAFGAEQLLADHAYTRIHPEWQAQLRERDTFLGSFSVDLSEFGIRKPDEGPATQMYIRGRVPWYDQGTAAAIAEGRIEVIDGNLHPIETLTEKGVRFQGREESYETVVYCTGFEPGLAEFLAEPDRFLHWDSAFGLEMPLTDGRCRSSVEPTLFFPGFDNTIVGGHSLGLWGFEAAERFAQSLRGE